MSELVWNWPQITYTALNLVTLFMVASMHGVPRSGTWNFPVALCTMAGIFFLLYMGGFWAGADP